jgi:hypothetical protein
MQALTDLRVRHHQKISKDSIGPIIIGFYDLLLLHYLVAGQIVPGYPSMAPFQMSCLVCAKSHDDRHSLSAIIL